MINNTEKIILTIFVSFLFICCPARRPLFYNLITSPSCRIDKNEWNNFLRRTRSEAQKWIKVVNYPHSSVRDFGKNSHERKLARFPDVEYLAVLSYPDDPEGVLSDRSFSYDDALALLWYSWTGNKRYAAGIAETLLMLQNSDGSWGFSFSVRDDNFYNEGYVRNGTVAWVANALVYFSKRYKHERAYKAAQKAVEYLISQRISDDRSSNFGLIKGGRGKWSPDYRNFFTDYQFEVSVSEHQFDSYLVLSQLTPSEGSALSKRIMETLWLENEGRFAVAADKRSVNKYRALDAAGAWGVLWLMSTGLKDLAEKSFQYTLREFSINELGLSGFKPYLDPVESPNLDDFEKLIYVEGTFGVGLAAYRLGKKEIAKQSLQLGMELSCLGGPGIPYANRQIKDFTTSPSAAPTLWFLFLEREMSSGLTSPLFNLNFYSFEFL
jgi:hypothetical protein